MFGSCIGGFLLCFAVALTRFTIVRKKTRRKNKKVRVSVFSNSVDSGLVQLFFIFRVILARFGTAVTGKSTWTIVLIDMIQVKAYLQSEEF